MQNLITFFILQFFLKYGIYDVHNSIILVNKKFKICEMYKIPLIKFDDFFNCNLIS